MMRNIIIILSILFIYCIAGDFLTDLSDDNELNYLESKETLSPTIENATAISPCSINVTWSCDECSTFNVSNYIVYWNDGVQEVENDVFNHVIDGLLADTLYEVYVSAIYDDTEFKSDTTSETTFIGDPPGISALCIYDITDTKMSLSWVTANDECPVKEYIIAFNGEILCDEGKEDSGSEITTEQYIELYRLTPYTNYTISISAVSTDGIIGEESSFPGMLTDEAVPGSPESITTRVISASVIELSWVPPLECNGILTDYILSFKLNSEEPFTRNLTTLETYVQVTDLLGCGNYEFNVQATTLAGRGKPVTTTDTTLPEVPPAVTNFYSSDITSRSSNLNWTPPDTLCPILNYILYGTGDVLWAENFDILNVTFGGNDENFELLSLIPWTYYNVCIDAVTDEGIGNSSCTDLRTLEDAPGPPTNLKVIEDSITSSKFLATWNAPVEKNGILEGFNVTLNNGPALYIEYENPSKNYSVSFDNLKAKTQYSVKVSAGTGAGLGEPSETNTETKAAESDNGSSAGLILGITIPLLVIIGAFAGLGYYYRDRIIERVNK